MWAALLKAAAAGERNTHGYSYAVASQGTPETLTIWHNGRYVFKGTNPDGSHYADPVQWVSYFVGGSAVHYIARASYGWPRSLGCAGLPYSAAERSYGYLPYGTLVTVTR